MNLPSYPSLASQIADLKIRSTFEAVDRNMAVIARMIPVGTVLLTLAQPSKVKDPWLLADGRAVDRHTYKELYDLIGTQFGVGDGSNTFTLPDLRDKILYGVPHGIDINAMTGQTKATAQTATTTATAGDSSATVTVTTMNRFYLTPMILGR